MLCPKAQRVLRMLVGSANSQVGLDKAQEILRLHVGKTKQGPYPVCSTLSRMVWRSGRRG